MAAYLLASISSAILVAKLFRLTDPRRAGSGNPGATNVYRLGGAVPASIVLLFDISKGLVPVHGAFLLGVAPLGLALVGGPDHAVAIQHEGDPSDPHIPPQRRFAPLG